MDRRPKEAAAIAAGAPGAGRTQRETEDKAGECIRLREESSESRREPWRKRSWYSANAFHLRPKRAFTLEHAQLDS